MIRIHRPYVAFWRITSPRLGFELGLYWTHAVTRLPFVRVTFLLWELTVGVRVVDHERKEDET